VLLAAGQLVRIVAGAVGDADPVHRRFHPRAPVLTGPFAVDQTQFDILGDGQFVDRLKLWNTKPRLSRRSLASSAFAQGW